MAVPVQSIACRLLPASLIRPSEACWYHTVIVSSLFSSFSSGNLPGLLSMCRGHFVGVHSSSFRDFMLKPELLRAIVDFGFEHPSEGEFLVSFAVTPMPAFR
jgi:hypothetical protein